MKLIYFVLGILFFSSLVLAESENTPRIIETQVNVSIIGYLDSNNSVKVNLTLFTEDNNEPIINYNGLTNGTNIFEVLKIQTIETLSCPIADVDSINQTVTKLVESQICEGRSCAARWAECETRYGIVHNEKQGLDSEIANLTSGDSKKYVKVEDYKNLEQERNSLQTQLNDEKQKQKGFFNSNIIYDLIKVGIGALLWWALGNSLRQDKGKKTFEEREGLERVRSTERPLAGHLEQFKKKIYNPDKGSAEKESPPEIHVIKKQKPAKEDQISDEELLDNLEESKDATP